MIIAYVNPYFDQTFWSFFVVIFQRIYALLTTRIAGIASDEIQLLVLMGVAASSALVGSFLILRKMTMLANSLSHTILLGIVIAFVLSGTTDPQQMSIPLLLFAAILMGLVTAFCTQFLTQTVRLQADASVGIVFTSFFALGVILVSLWTRNAHIGIEAVMGNVDALTSHDIPFVYLILGINVVLIYLFFKEYTITTFDPALASVMGFSSLFYNYLLMTQVSMTAIGAFRAVGVLMVLAFICVPPLMARMLTHHFKTMLLLSILIGCLASLVGVALSRHFFSVYAISLSTAGLVVCVLALFFFLTLCYKKISSSRSSFQINDQSRSGTRECPKC